MNPRIEKLKEFLQQSPEDCFLNHALALELIKLGKDNEAKILFEKNLKNDPKYLATYYHYGKLLEREKNEEKAAKMYESGMECAKAANDRHTYSEIQSAYEDLVY